MFIASVTALWDPEALVWVGTSDETPGLVIETEGLDAMLLRARGTIPELAALNGLAPFGPEGFSIRLQTSEVRDMPLGSTAPVAYLTPVLMEVLRPYGCQYVRAAKADLAWWFSPISDRHFAVDSKIKSRITANAIMKQAGLPEDF